MTADPPSRTKTAAARLVLLVIGALGTWPWVATLSMRPMTVDATTWITRSAPGAPDLAQWLFGTQHFNVGWRPLTALSYTVDGWLAGTAALAFRLTDLGLHLGAAALVYALWRALFPERPRWGGVLATALFLAHPSTEEVVPFLARRSYSLTTVLQLGALTIVGRAVAAPRSGGALVARSTAVATLLFLALVANEVAVLAVPMALVVAVLGARSRRHPWRTVALAALLPALAVGTWYLLRAAVVGGVGGYQIEGDPQERAGAVFAAFWHTLLAVPSDLPLGRAGVAALVVLGPALAWSALVQPLVGPRAGGDRRRLALLAWIVAHAALYSAFGVWFPRQAHPAVPALALLVADLAQGALRATRPVARAVQGLPAAALLLWLGLHSPLLHGQDPERLAAWRAHDAMLADVEDAVAAYDGPGDLRLVVPFRQGEDRDGEFADLKRASRDRFLPRMARQPETWGQFVARGRDVVVETYVFLAADGPPEPVVFQEIDGRPALFLPDRRPYFVKTGMGLLNRFSRADTPVWADQLAFDPGRDVDLWLPGPEGGELHRLAARDPDVEPEAPRPEGRKRRRRGR